MTEYKGVTHTIVEMLARNKIQAVPRKKDTPRTELPEVGRPKDDRFGEVPTRQQEIQKKIIDEDDASPSAEPGQIAGPAPEKEKKPRKLDIEDIGKQKPTQVVINPELDNTPNIFASTEVKGKLVEDEKERIKKEVAKAQEMQKARKEAEHIAKHVSGLKSFGGFKVTGKLTAKDIEHGADIRRRLNALKESRNDYNSVSIQYQTKGGNWVTARKTSDSSSNIMLAMRNVQKTYSSNRVRAIGPKGLVLDFQPIDPADIATEDIQEGGKFPIGAAAKAVFSGVAVNAALGAVQNNYPTAYGIAQKLKKGWDDLPPTPGYATFARQAPSGNVLGGKYEKAVQNMIRTGKGSYPGAQVAKAKISETVDKIVNEILTYKNSASLRGRDAVAQRDAAIAQAPAQQAQAQQQQQQQPPQKKKKQQPVQGAKDPRHTGIEVDEPKFNQSIQRVAAHTKWNADAVHTYKHADGSKTRVDQELGTKIHKAIHSAPTRHRAKLVQYIHKSAGNLKHVLGKE